MNVLTQADGWLIFLGFAVITIGLVWLATRGGQTSDEHLLAGRQVSIWPGAFSIAVTWIWAPAVFICAQKSYQQGLAGIFWFTFPNVLTFFTFAPLALRLRHLMPAGYSMPDYIWRRFGGNRSAHLMFLAVTLGYELGAIIINTLAGGELMHRLTGIPLQWGILTMAGVALFYAVWRGLPGSIVTDFVQMSLILVIALVLVPWTVHQAGGWHVVAQGLGGQDGTYHNPLDPWVAYSFGIPATLGLLAGPIADQMFYQRAMACRASYIVRTFAYGGLLFGIVPIVLSIFGFLAASPSVQPQLGITDPQMVSVSVVAHYLPRWCLYGFALMALCALSSTLDSAHCAIGSLGSVDLYRRYVNPSATDRQMVGASRVAMLTMAALGTGIALVPGLKLLWVFLIYGALASAALVPTVLALYWKRLSATGASLGIFLSLLAVLPLSIYGNVTGSPHIVVLGAVISVPLGAGTALLASLWSPPAEQEEDLQVA